MTGEPSEVTAETLGNEVKRAYGLELEEINFRSKGWGGDSYLAVATTGERLFVKVPPLSGPEWASAPTEPRFYLPLLHQLHAQEIINVPKLILTRDGGCSAEVDGFEIVLYEFIDGEVVGFGKLSEPILAALAGMIGKLHTATPQLRFGYEFRETYALGVEAALLRSLDQPVDANTPGIGLLSANLPRIREPVLHHLAQFNTLQVYARNLDKPPVVCHTDLHGGNLMFDSNRELVLLDWENALLAPPEHDLYFMAGEPEFRSVFLPNYEREAGPIEMDPGLLAFYSYRRALEDVAGFLTRILAGEGSPERDREDLDYLLANVAWMDRIEAAWGGFLTDLT